jgi:hypothetical protein
MIKPAEFSEYGWKRFLPFIQKQPEGGMVLIVAEVLPTQNWPRISIGTFDADARKRLRRALKREARP